MCSFLRIHDKDGARQAAHIADATEHALEPIQLILQVLRLFLGQPLELATLFARLQILHIPDAQLNGLEVRQHATEPALVDEELAATLAPLL